MLKQIKMRPKKVAKKLKRVRQVKLREPSINNTDVCKLDFKIFHPLVSCAFEIQSDQSICRSKNLFWSIF